MSVNEKTLPDIETGTHTLCWKFRHLCDSRPARIILNAESVDDAWSFLFIDDMVLSRVLQYDVRAKGGEFVRVVTEQPHRTCGCGIWSSADENL